MIARRYETIVGIFVFVSLIALFVMVLIIAQQEGLFQEYVEYRTVFRNASGLKVGSEVHLAGVTVGSINQITITPTGAIVVTFKVIKKHSDRIRWDSEASIVFMGLLGDKSLDITAGNPDKPPVPSQGFVASAEPFDISQLLAKATPGLEDLQKILSNLAGLTAKMSDPNSDFSKTLDQVSQMVSKINQGKGTLGLAVNDQKLYKEATETMTGANKFINNLERSLFGTSGKKPALSDQAHQTLDSANQALGELKGVTSSLPGIAKKLDSFLTNLEKAGKGLPGLVTSGETLFSDADIAAKAAQQSWLLRWYVPKPEEHTIRMDGDARKD